MVNKREANLVVQVGISPKVMCKDRGRMAKLERIRYFESKKKPSTKDCPELECSVVDGFLTLIGNIHLFLRLYCTKI